MLETIPAAFHDRPNGNCLKVRAGGQDLTVLRQFPGGFAVTPCAAGGLRGFVDLYRGDTHLGRCLIVAAPGREGEAAFEYKRRPAPIVAPPVDYVLTCALPAH